MGRNSDYGNGMYQQLMEIMGCLEMVEKESEKKLILLTSELISLKKKIMY